MDRESCILKIIDGSRAKTKKIQRKKTNKCYVPGNQSSTRLISMAFRTDKISFHTLLIHYG